VTVLTASFVVAAALGKVGSPHVRSAGDRAPPDALVRL